VALANELQTLRASKPRTFDQWLDIAEPEERDMVLEAIQDRELRSNALAVVLRRNGVPITRERIIEMREATE
jgi:hypothetical protein